MSDARGMSGPAETAEPAPSTIANGASAAKREPSISTMRQSSSASTPIPALRKQPSRTLVVPTSPSAGSSPRTSRNTSPVRPQPRQDMPQSVARVGLSRSRKNSQDASPSRPALLASVPSTAPSAAAIQRALSAATVPQLKPGPVSDAVSQIPRPLKVTGGSPGDSTPHWPASPGLKSPPPSTSSRHNSLLGQRKTESLPAAPPSVVVQSSTPLTPTPPMQLVQSVDSEARRADEQPLAVSKPPSRGASGPKSTLETVQESGTSPQDTLVGPSTASPSQVKVQGRLSDDDRPPTISESASEENHDKHTKIGESESEGNKSDGRGRRDNDWNVTAAPRPKTVPPKHTYTPLSSAKSRPAEGSLRNMTVETETVTSIPQAAIGVGPNDRNANGRSETSGSVRTRPSNETIRPKRDRKRPTRKAPSINSGTASTKADIFEQRVASTAEQANSSDSEETFVYESNPPDPPPHASRHHSRTPSAASHHSHGDQQRGKSNVANAFDNHRVAGKRSMKFSNNPYNDPVSPTDSASGTVRAHSRLQHFGRFGRGGNSHTSVAGQDSPFSQASKLRHSSTAHSARQNSRPSTPKSVQTRNYGTSQNWNRKDDLSQYDYDGEGADDEQTPFLGSTRTAKSGRNTRRPHSGSIVSITNSHDRHRQSWWQRCRGCTFGMAVVLMLLTCTLGFLAWTNKEMYQVEVKKIQNVLASEQEIMLDLLVGAINPNVFTVSVTEMDINVFAKSRHVGTSKLWREHGRDGNHGSSSDTPARRNRVKRQGDATHPQSNAADWQDLSAHWRPASAVDEGTDPTNDDEGDPQTMLLGRILHFDSALDFEGSPIKRHVHYSVGELRLAHPGNRTEAGGSERWEKVLQYPFELIIRGVLKYSLPISSRGRTAAIGASVLVHPEDGIDSAGRMRTEVPDRSEEWQWVEFEDLEDDLDDGVGERGG
ncbi:Vacuolar inheritance and morphology protein [Elasticomyces elasticus]|nr:Vacuolar inheritance and morphology protein [Elasticomyces elasticus]